MKVPELIGKNVKAYREDQGLSQEKLAEISGLHRTYIGQVEGGKRNITVVNLFRIAEALEVEAYLFLIANSLEASHRKGRK